MIGLGEKGGIHAVSADNLEELYDYLHPPGEVALVLLEFAGQVYVAKNPDYDRTIIVGQKARPIAAIVFRDMNVEIISNAYNIPTMSVTELFQTEISPLADLVSYGGYDARLEDIELSYGGGEWFFDQLPPSAIPNIEHVEEMGNRMVINPYYRLVVSPKDDPTHHSASVTFTAMKAIFSLESTEPKLLRVIAEALIRCGTEYRQYDLCDIFYIPPHYEEAEFVESMEEFESYRGEGPFAVVFDEWGTWDYALIDSNIELTMSIDKDQYELVDYYQYKKPSPEDQDKMDSYLINTAGISSEIAGAYIEWQ